MEVHGHRRLEQRFSNESGIQEDDPLQCTENIKKLTNLLKNNPVTNELTNTPSSVADTSFYNERCESTLFGGTSVDGSSSLLSSTNSEAQLVISSPMSSNLSLDSATITEVSYEADDSDETVTLSEFTSSSSQDSIERVQEFDGDFRVDTPPPNPIFKKPLQRGDNRLMSTSVQIFCRI